MRSMDRIIIVIIIVIITEINNSALMFRIYETVLSTFDDVRHLL